MEKVFKIYKMKSEPSDVLYWRQKSVQERLTALEELRLQYIYYSENEKSIEQGLQRVLTITRKPQS
jgi:hypothetical protein